MPMRICSDCRRPGCDFSPSTGHGAGRTWRCGFLQRQLFAGEPIKLFNNGNMRRDFTYIDDVVESVVRLVSRPARPIRSFQVRRPIRAPAARRGASTISATTSRSSCSTSCAYSKRRLAKRPSENCCPCSPATCPRPTRTSTILCAMSVSDRRRRLPTASRDSLTGIAPIIAFDAGAVPS